MLERIQNAKLTIWFSLLSWVTLIRGRYWGRSIPLFGLMSIGEEEAKGNDLTKEAFPF